MSVSLASDNWNELAVRESDGLAVTLLWTRAAGRVKVAVVDAQLDEGFEFCVPGADALAAFNHPFAFAARDVSFGGVGSPTPERSTVS